MIRGISTAIAVFIVLSITADFYSVAWGNSGRGCTSSHTPVQRGANCR